MIRKLVAALSAAALLTALLVSPSSPAYALPANPAGSTGGTWVSLWGDDFNNASLDLNKWRPNWLGASDSAVTKGANSAETACMDPANVSTSSGSLHLALTTSSVTCNSVTHPRRGAMVETGSDNITFYPDASGAGTCNSECYFEASIRLPATANYVKNWPAFWSVSQNATWPQGGENDVMEGLCTTCAGSDGDVMGTVHYWGGSSWTVNPSTPSTFRDGNYHTYGLQWSTSGGTMRWYYDGTLIGTATGAETWSPHFLILDYTTGSWGGPTSSPATMDVDYVSVWGR